MSASCPQLFGKDLLMFHLDDDPAALGAGRTPADRTLAAPAEPHLELAGFPTVAEQAVIDDIFTAASRLSAVFSWVVVAVVMGVIAAALLS